MLQIYYLKVSDYKSVPDGYFKPLVSRETWKQACCYRHSGTKRTKLIGEAMSRQLLQQFWQLKPEDYRIVKGGHGKPYVSPSALSAYFNLSHSGDYIVCALCNREVGIDIERRGTPRLEVARRFFHPQETTRLEATPPALQKELFFNLWSVKESFLKYTGSGLSSPLASFEVCFSGTQAEIKKGHSRVPVSIRECPIDEGYSCFVCCDNFPAPFSIKPFRL